MAEENTQQAQTEEHLYLVKIKITSPPKTLKLETSVGRTPEIIAMLERIGGKAGKDTIPMFEIVDDNNDPIFSLNKCANKLSGILDGIQNDFMESGGDYGWYVPESRVESLEKAIVERLDTARDDLRQQLAENYEDCKELFKTRLHDYLDVVGKMELYQHLENEFPAMPTAIAKLGYEKVRWEQITRKVEGDGAAQRAQREVAQQAIAELQNKLPALQDEGCDRVVSILETLERVEGGNVSEYYEGRLSEHTERLETICSTWKAAMICDHPYLAEMKNDLSLLILKARKGDVSEAIDSIRFTWRERFKLLGAGEGIQRLQQWIYPEPGLEAEIADIRKELEDASEEEKARLTRKLKRLEKELKALLDSVKVVEREEAIA